MSKQWLNNKEKLYEIVTMLHRKGYGSRKIAKMLGLDDRVRKVIEYWIYPLRGKTFRPRTDPDLTPSPDLSYVIGVRLGDGYVGHWRRDYVVTLRVKDKDFAETFKECLAKVSRRKVRLLKDKEYWRVTAYSKPLYLSLKSKNISAYSHIVEQFPADFIRGFADSEGCATFGKTHNDVNIKISNTDRQLIEYVSYLLERRFQIRSSICIIKHFGSKAKKLVYELDISSQQDVTKFAKSIGFSIRRKSVRLPKNE
jgi:intein-encoded DNA endonuclease-like protein